MHAVTMVCEQDHLVIEMRCEVKWARCTSSSMDCCRFVAAVCVIPGSDR